MQRISYFIFLALASLIVLTSFQSIEAQNQGVGDDGPAAVTVKGQRLFIYYSMLDGKTPTARARRTGQIVERITADHMFEPGLLHLSDTPNGTNLVYGSETIATVTTDDAKAHKSSTRRLARSFADKLRAALVERKEEITAGRVAYAVSVTIGATIAFVIAMALLFQFGAVIGNKLQEWKGTKIKSIKIQKATLLSADMTVNLISSAIQIAQWLIVVIALYLYIVAVLEAFPNTTALGIQLKQASIEPLENALHYFLDYLPNLFKIGLLGIITYGAIAMARFFFDAIDAGTIAFSGFERDWARPTYKLVRMLIMAFFLVLALPYVPGWESESFKQVGLLFGLLISLGSTSVIGHIMAGTVLTYSKAFHVGDRIQIGSCTGDIIEKSLFVTRIKTPKNEIISIPNAEILNSHITNYSKMASTGELILHTKVTIGYDLPWQEVHKLLKNAALNTEDVLHEPEPFVLEQELGDFSICYELNAFTKEAQSMQRIYSELHRKIIDQFNEAGLEIMSPNFVSLRDGNPQQLPAENLAKGYKQPKFMVAVDVSKGKETKSG